MTDASAAASASPLAEIARRIALEAGTRILDQRRRGVSVAATKSSGTDIVTEADRASEAFIVAALQEARPSDSILGEEGSGVAGTSGITWVIDPIDGTVNYLYDLPAYCVSIAATVSDAEAMADGRRAIAGAVYNPRSDELFDAFAGGGARLNGEPIRVSGKDDIGTALIGTGFGYSAERRSEQAAALLRLLPRARDIRRIGSAAYDLCMVACGRLDAYYELGLQPWDYAAGALIAREAGATLLGRDRETPPGEPYLFAADPGLVATVRELVLGR